MPGHSTRLHPPLRSRPDVEQEAEGGLGRLYGGWSESSETLNEFDSDTPNLPYEPRPLLDDQVHTSLSSSPQDRMVLTFASDKRQRTTRLMSDGRVIYSYSSLYENPSSKAGLFTQLRDGNGRVVGTYIVPSASKSLVKLGDSEPLLKKTWLSHCGILSLNCAKFQVGNRWFKWRCLNDSGRVSVVLRDHSIKSTPTVARFTCVHRIESLVLTSDQKTAKRTHLRNHSFSHSQRRSRRRCRSWRASIELNPDYRDVWDYAVFSLIVLECFKGGRTVPPLEYEDETGSNVSYLANLIGLFAGTAA